MQRETDIWMNTTDMSAVAITTLQRNWDYTNANSWHK